MKKILIIVMSIATLSVGCSDDKEEGAVFESQNLSLSTDAVVFDMNGDGSSNAVTVTSTADWRLAGDVSWCTPSATKGSTGASIVFSATKNDTGEYREVNLYFICGNAAQKVTVKQFPEEIVEFAHLKDEYTIGADGGRITIRVNTNLDVFNTEISESWVAIHAEKDDNETKWVQFVFDANKTFYDRPVTIKMFKGTDYEKSIVVTQTKFTGVIITGESDYKFGIEGGKVIVTATANVSFSASITTVNALWISAVETSSSGTDILTKSFEITCQAGAWTRSGVVTLSPTSGTSAVVNISQVDPNPELFEIPDDLFAKRLIAVGYIAAEKGGKYSMTYVGHTATSLLFYSSDYAEMNSVEGIERLVNLTTLTIHYVNVRKLDLSKNAKFTKLSNNFLPLEELILGDLPITSYSVATLYNNYSKTNKAKSFTASSSKLTSINVNHNNYAEYDHVEWVDVTGCPALTKLECNRNSGNLKHIYLTAAQKAAYDDGTLTITTHADFDKAGIVVK